MIIFNTCGIVFCVLDNPKCGSSTLRVWYDTLYAQTNVIFDSALSYGDYADPNYAHCNLEGAVKFLETREDIDISKVVFISTIRNPVERYLSAYYYSLNYSNVSMYDPASPSAEEDFVKFILDEVHFQHFYPDKFRVYKNYKVHTIKLESIYDDFISLFKSLNVNINCDLLKIVTNQTKRTININLSDKTLHLIKDTFKLDYVDGNY
jgi:hypothetical protein